MTDYDHNNCGVPIVLFKYIQFRQYIRMSLTRIYVTVNRCIPTVKLLTELVQYFRFKFNTNASYVSIKTFQGFDRLYTLQYYKHLVVHHLVIIKSDTFDKFIIVKKTLF